jgi:AbrB family looped-hinge helix DNA binding protein
MHVTEKGQVTIPKALRDELGILPGSEVEFEADGDRLILRKSLAGRRGRAIVERLRGRGDVSLSTDEILAMTRGSD